MEAANIVVVGAGVVGLSVAARLSEENEHVIVLERNWKPGLETSTHNSGVIHSGIHYPSGTLKARLCVQGNSMLYDLCERYNISYRKLGKLTVAVDESEINGIEELFRRGESNGVEGLRMIDSARVGELEPEINAQMALYSPSSGIIEPDELIDYFHAQLMKHGGAVATNTELTSMKRTNSGYELTGLSAGHPFTIQSSTVINCAGLNADRVAAMVGMDIDKLGYRLKYFKGDYYRVSGSPLVRMLVYPMPKAVGLGTHVTPDLAGSIKLGPNAYCVEDLDYAGQSREQDFKEDVSRFLPAVSNREIYYDSSGIRPIIGSGNESFRDFLIRHEADRGFPGFINLIGMESPGLTASPAIGEYIHDMYESEIKK